MYGRLRHDLATAHDRCRREAGRGPGITASKLGTVKRPDGKVQVTYNGLTLYRYSKDAKAGDANGQGTGKLWYAITPAGKITKTSAAGSSAPSGSTASTAGSGSAGASGSGSAGAGGGGAGCRRRRMPRRPDDPRRQATATMTTWAGQATETAASNSLEAKNLVSDVVGARGLRLFVGVSNRLRRGMRRARFRRRGMFRFLGGARNGSPVGCRNAYRRRGPGAAEGRSPRRHGNYRAGAAIACCPAGAGRPSPSATRCP